MNLPSQAPLIQSKPTVWRGLLFDSVLEADWAASLTVWGVDWIHHPGSIDLSNGQRWEPDFLLRGAGEWGTDIMLEVKGPSDDRIHKPWLAQSDHPELQVIVGRVPYLRGDDMSPYPAAVWEPDEFVWDLNGRGKCYVSGQHATRTQPGLKFYKAIKNSRQIR